MYKVYMWTHRQTGKRYIGATGETMHKRAGSRGHHYVGSPLFYAAIKKYGLKAFTLDIVQDNLTKDEASSLEAAVIAKYDTTNPEHGYNLQVGGFPTEYASNTAERAAKIAETLKAQRSTIAYRGVMSARMKAVWDDPVRRAEILEKRKGKLAGRKAVAVFCSTNGILYRTIHEAAEALGVSYATISAQFKRHGDTITVGMRRGKGTTYTLHKVLNVHVKESELLEASAGNAGGNQQPSQQIDRTPTVGRLND